MKRKALKAAVPYTLPVMMGYIFLGMAFGILLHNTNVPDGWALFMSIFVYAGSMQFVAIELLTAPLCAVFCRAGHAHGECPPSFLWSFHAGAI